MSTKILGVTNLKSNTTYFYFPDCTLASLNYLCNTINNDKNSSVNMICDEAVVRFADPLLDKDLSYFNIKKWCKKYILDNTFIERTCQEAAFNDGYLKFLMNNIDALLAEDQINGKKFADIVLNRIESIINSHRTQITIAFSKYKSNNEPSTSNNAGFEVYGEDC